MRTRKRNYGGIFIGQWIPTNGKGLWSNVAKKVKVVSLEKVYESEDGKFSDYELTIDNWNTVVEGLIYTDPKFIRELRRILKDSGFKGVSTLDYTEQGMQGDDYVSLSSGPEFSKSYTQKIRNK